jgi:RNA polymerase primary sigma factor
VSTSTQLREVESIMHASAAAAATPPEPWLARESEPELLSAARDGSAHARARLVESYMPLIGKVARIYTHVPSIDRSELMQEGVVGILRALERFNPELGTPFWAYASWWVRQAMQQLVSEISRPLVLSDRALRQLARVREARRCFAREHAREPSVRELADASELTVEQLQRLLVAERQPRSLEEPLDDATGTGATFGDLVCDPCAEDAYDELAMHLLTAEVPGLLDRLSAREREVIDARFGLGREECTLGELGTVMGVSAERIRQIEQSALEKMRGRVRPRPAVARTRGKRTRRARTRATGRSQGFLRDRPAA